MEVALQKAAGEALQKFAPPISANGAVEDGPTKGNVPNGTTPIDDCVMSEGIKAQCEMLLTLVAFSTCQRCGDMLSKENEKSCNLVLCPCGHVVCYLCGRIIMKTSDMAGWDMAHEVFKKVHEDTPNPVNTPLCCVPNNPIAEAEHLSHRVTKAIDQLFTSLAPAHRVEAYTILSKLVDELTK